MKVEQRKERFWNENQPNTIPYLEPRHRGGLTIICMRRQCANEREAFPKSIEAYTTSGIEPALRHRGAELDKGWEELNQGWKEIEKRRAEVGVRPRTDEEGMVTVNIGGSITSLSVSLLAEGGLFDDGNALGGLLEGVWESKRVPRDAAGRVVLDESSDCLRHITRTMLYKGSSSAKVTTGPEMACAAGHLMYVSYVFGTWRSMPTEMGRTILKGASTFLTPLELVPMSAVIHEWCLDKPGEMNLIYRASRDGFDTNSFRARCTKEIPNTITLIRVACDGAAGDSVVGGYSTFPWAGISENTSVASPRAFIFMLKDGTFLQSKKLFMPVMWPRGTPQSNALGFGAPPIPAAHLTSVRATPDSGPHFGTNDLSANFTEEGRCTIKTGQDVYRADSAAFLGLDGNQITDIEVYGVRGEEQGFGRSELKLSAGAAADFARATAGDVRSFGEAIASSLTEERVALQHAFKAMKEAGTRVTVASRALQTVYGPDQEANNEGFVVKPNARGFMMTTLRSTLQACPESALAARFDEGKWAVAEIDCDERGRRLIDCRPSVLSKVLDVLRIRKRESWSLSKAGKEAGGMARGTAQVVVVAEHDRACFEEFVDMYFPGCQSFITDLVVIDAAPAEDASAQLKRPRLGGSFGPLGV